MKKDLMFYCCLAFMAGVLQITISTAQNPGLEGEGWQLYLNKNGTINQIMLNEPGAVDTVQFKIMEKYPAISGEFVWTGFDYLGEPTPYNRRPT